MHTLLRVTGVLSGVESSVVLGLGFRGWAAPEPVHEPALVVPGHPRRGAVLQVGEGADRAGAERGTLAHALGLVQPDRGLAEPVVQGVADCPDRRDQSFEHQRLAVMYCGVLTSGVRMSRIRLNSDYAEVCVKPRIGGDGLRSWELLVGFSA